MKNGTGRIGSEGEDYRFAGKDIGVMAAR